MDDLPDENEKFLEQKILEQKIKDLQKQKDIADAIKIASRMIMNATNKVHVPPIPINAKPRYNYNDTPPNFYEGEIVEIDLGYFGRQKVPGEQYIVEGIIVGKRYISESDTLWIVDFGEYYFKPSYPFRVMTVPIHAIIKQDKLNWE